MDKNFKALTEEEQYEINGGLFDPITLTVIVTTVIATAVAVAAPIVAKPRKTGRFIIFA